MGERFDSDRSTATQQYSATMDDEVQALVITTALACARPDSPETMLRAPCSRPLSDAPVHHEDQDHCPAGAQVLCVDWRIDPRVALHLPADVDLQGGVRRVWPVDRAPQVLLSAQREQEVVVLINSVSLA